MNTEDQKKLFVHNEIISSAINAAFQHGNVYCGSKNIVDKAEKKKYDKTCEDFRKDLKDYFLHSFAIDPNNIEGAIELLCKKITMEWGDKHILNNNEFRVGTAQKLINLYLKYCWCLGWSPKPPHCPFDRQIIEYLQKNGPDELKKKIMGILWTQMGSKKIGGLTQGMVDYKNLVDSAEIVRKNEECASISIAEWELELWNKNNINSDKYDK